VDCVAQTLVSIGLAGENRPQTLTLTGFLAIMGVVVYWYQLGAKWLYRPIKGIGGDVSQCGILWDSLNAIFPPFPHKDPRARVGIRPFPHWCNAT
jgi:hypothetical protein